MKIRRVLTRDVTIGYARYKKGDIISPNIYNCGLLTLGILLQCSEPITESPKNPRPKRSNINNS